MSQPQFLYLITSGWKTGKEHKIEIWFAEFNKKYYLISEHREHPHWVQNINHNPKITFNVSGKALEGIARTVDPIKDAELADVISELMSRKYKWNQGLIVEITPSSSP